MVFLYQKIEILFLLLVYIRFNHLIIHSRKLFKNSSLTINNSPITNQTTMAHITNRSSISDEVLALLANPHVNLLNLPHFRGLVKKVRHGHYSFKTAITDIIDNVVLKANRIDITVQFREGKLYRIIISDDYANGFENIKETGTANPMNWTHSREGQASDSETSEYGTGLKEASCYLATIMRIFTQAVKDAEVSFHKVECNFDEMVKREVPVASFMVDITEIGEATYQEQHPFETGSTIVLDGIRAEDTEFANEHQCIDALKVIIAEAYSDIIASRPELAIRVNEVHVLPEHDHFREVLHDDGCLLRRIHTFVAVELGMINGVPKVVKTMAKVMISAHEQIYYDFTETDKTAKSTKESVSIREITTEIGKQQCERMIADNNIRKANIVSCSTNGTRLEETHLFKGAVRHKRNGRNYGDVQLVNLIGAMSNDGYLNHVYHEIAWKSKELNPHLGICSNKQINTEKKGMLRLSICKLLGKLNARLKSKQKKSRRSSGDNDSDDSSVSSVASTVSDITMASAASSNRRRRTQATAITEPIRRVTTTATSVAAAPVAPAAQPPAPEPEPEVAVNNVIAEEPRPPGIIDLIMARLDDSIAAAENTLAEQVLLPPAPPAVPEPEAHAAPAPAPEAHAAAAAPGQLHPIYTRITNQDRTYLTCKDAKIALENISIYASEHPNSPEVEEDLMKVITAIANQRGKHRCLIDIIKHIMVRGVTDDAHVVGGSRLAEIHGKYITDEDLYL